MASAPTRGITALERYREQLRGTERCGACGTAESAGEWTTRYRDGRLVYRRVCPRCGEIERREFRIG